jgi:hypothetical protein
MVDLVANFLNWTPEKEVETADDQMTQGNIWIPQFINKSPELYNEELVTSLRSHTKVDLSTVRRRLSNF